MVSPTVGGVYYSALMPTDIHCPDFRAGTATKSRSLIGVA